jgi:hypothetical protein
MSPLLGGMAAGCPRFFMYCNPEWWKIERFVVEMWIFLILIPAAFAMQERKRWSVMAWSVRQAVR